jgi:hypothetical protein
MVVSKIVYRIIFGLLRRTFWHDVRCVTSGLMDEMYTQTFTLEKAFSRLQFGSFWGFIPTEAAMFFKALLRLPYWAYSHRLVYIMLRSAGSFGLCVRPNNDE